MRGEGVPAHQHHGLAPAECGHGIERGRRVACLPRAELRGPFCSSQQDSSHISQCMLIQNGYCVVGYASLCACIQSHLQHGIC